ncbi:MAG: hypothetical protein ACK6BC_15065, partial [Cyanobacteriota bacterium]
PPRLWPNASALTRALVDHAHHAAHPLLPGDAEELLAVSQEAAHSGRPAPWSCVVPLYPTSPVEQA